PVVVGRGHGDEVPISEGGPVRRVLEAGVLAGGVAVPLLPGEQDVLEPERADVELDTGGLVARAVGRIAAGVPTNVGGARRSGRIGVRARVKGRGSPVDQRGCATPDRGRWGGDVQNVGGVEIPAGDAGGPRGQKGQSGHAAGRVVSVHIADDYRVAALVLGLEGR